MTSNVEKNQHLVEHASAVVVAYIKNHVLPKGELSTLIADVYAALDKTTAQHGPAAAEEAEKQKPKVSVRQSISSDHLVCLEDGKKFKSLKRHLSTYHGLTPDEYRLKWQLPKNYPMVAATYSEERSAIARNLGLGKFGRKTKVMPK